MTSHLERLIKQKVPFATEELKAQIGVLFLSYNFTSTQQVNLKEYNITLQQYNILRILRGQYPKPANITLLRERMLDKMCDASRLVNRLFLLGLVSKKANPDDKRNADVIITDKALKCLEEIDAKNIINQTLFDSLPKEDINTFNKILDKIFAKL